MTEDFFSMDFSDIGQLIKELDMFDERQNAAFILPEANILELATMIQPEDLPLLCAEIIQALTMAFPVSETKRNENEKHLP